MAIVHGIEMTSLPPDLCIVVASDAEYRIARRSLPSANILKTGIGAPNFLQSHLPECSSVLITGFAGALDPALKAGEAVSYDRCLNEKGGSIDCLPLKAFSQAIGISVSRVIINASEKHRLRHAHKADAVDMESFEILKACRERELKASVLRVISDEAQEDLPDFNLAIKDDGSIDRRELPRVLLARPFLAMKFARSVRVSALALESALRRFASIDQL